MDGGSSSRIRGRWRAQREREAVGTENPEALYTHSQLGGQVILQSPIFSILLPPKPCHFNQISPTEEY